MLSPPSWSCKQGSDFSLVTPTPHRVGSRCLSKKRFTSLPAASPPRLCGDAVWLQRHGAMPAPSSVFHRFVVSVSCSLRRAPSANAPRSEGLDRSEIGPYYVQVWGQATISDKNR